jgi:multidrug transporter EmrE-like cation transporter
LRSFLGVFAAISVLAGRFVFSEQVPPATWVGLTLIFPHGLVRQFGPR